MDLFNPKERVPPVPAGELPERPGPQAGRREPGDILHPRRLREHRLPGIEDGPIEELYVLVSEARASMGRDVPVHLFHTGWTRRGSRRWSPSPMSPTRARPSGAACSGYRYFEASRRPPKVRVDASGAAYVIVPGPQVRAR